MEIGAIICEFLETAALATELQFGTNYLTLSLTAKLFDKLNKVKRGHREKRLHLVGSGKNNSKEVSRLRKSSEYP